MIFPFRGCRPEPPVPPTTVAVNGSTLNFKYFLTSFYCKSVSSYYIITYLTSTLPNDIKSKLTFRSCDITHSRSRSCIYLLFWVCASLLSLHHSLFLSAISLGRSSVDQTFHYQNKSRAWVIRYWVKKLMTAVFTCKPVSSCLFRSLRLTSKMFISSFDHSTVILIVEWKALSVSIDCFKESSSCSQIKNITNLAALNQLFVTRQKI